MQITAIVNGKFNTYFREIPENYSMEICIIDILCYDICTLYCDHAHDYVMHKLSVQRFSFSRTFTDRGVGNSIILQKLGCVQGLEWSQIVAMLLAQPAGLLVYYYSV